jgi:hypothetical protein
MKSFAAERSSATTATALGIFRQRMREIVNIPRPVHCYHTDYLVPRK